MPTPPKKHRTYCKGCKDFTVHQWTENKELTCETCNTIDTGYNINEVEPTLIRQQRERYKNYTSANIRGLYGAILGGGFGLNVIMALDKLKIVECDAGQKEIDLRKKQEREEHVEQYRQLLKDYKDNYKNLNRNDKCSCGSNLKYKKCHLLILRNKGLKI